MTVALDSYVQPPASRIPSPTTITDVVATLHGSQAQSAARTYVISGHYDWRCTDVLDIQCLAPGADDDASVVATVLELARVMATRQFDATIVFMAVAGEEQGLYGSKHFADEAKAAGTDIEGMLNNNIVGNTHGGQGISRPNDTELRWNANPEPDVKGYEIVWRYTDESRWTHTIPVGNVTDYTAKGMAPDNFFFGVRAIDNDGYRSPVSFPVPASR